VADVIKFPDKNKRAVVDVVRRDEAVAKVREILRGVRAVEGLAFRRMMDLGDALIPARNAAGYGGWGAFLRDCGLPVRDAQIAMQLAKARPEIEAENAKRASQSQPALSIRAALELIRPKNPKSEHGSDVGMDADTNADPDKSGPPAITIDAVLIWLKTATLAEKRRVAVALAQDTATIRALLPTKAVPKKATPQQIFEKAMVLFTPDGAPVTH
jgi:hypothetical protein